MFPFRVDCVEDSISAGSETSLFSGKNLPAWRQWKCASFGRFSMAAILFAGMDAAFCSLQSRSAVLCFAAQCGIVSTLPPRRHALMQAELRLCLRLMGRFF